MTMGEKKNSELQLVGAAQFSDLTAQSAAAPRKRSHLLLHAGPDDQVQRLVIAAQLGTYVRPHQHEAQWEMLALQNGCMDIVMFDEDATVLGRITLDRAAPIVQIPRLVWHTSVVREPDTIVVEIKPGPYVPNRFAGWAPEEGSERTGSFLRWVTSAETGRRWQE
jgi:cupin fold WbuC family metalloprotein